MKKQNVRKAYQLSLEAELSFLWNIGLSGLKWLGTKGWKSQVLKWSQVSKWQLRFGNERKQNLSSIFSSGNKLKCLGVVHFRCHHYQINYQQMSERTVFHTLLSIFCRINQNLIWNIAKKSYHYCLLFHEWNNWNLFCYPTIGICN